MIRYSLGATMMAATTTARSPTKTIDPALLRQVIRRVGGTTVRLLTPTTIPTTTATLVRVPKQVIGDRLALAVMAPKPAPAPKPGLVATPEPPPPTPPEPEPEPVPSPLPPPPAPPPPPPPSYQGRSDVYDPDPPRAGGMVDGEFVPIDPLLPGELEAIKAQAAQPFYKNPLVLLGGGVLVAYVVLK